jgi:hypothetical protein
MLPTIRPQSLILSTLVIVSLFSVAGCSPTPPAPAPKPEVAATPVPQNPPTDQELAKSLAFPTTIIAVTNSSITFTDADQKTPLTLPIDSATEFIGFQSLAEIKPTPPLGIRLSADKKRIFVLNAKIKQ